MKAQEIFDKVAAHLTAQGYRSYDAGMCMYRDGYGGMCAIGCLIKDEDYTTTMDDGYSVTDLYNYEMLPSYVLPEDMIDDESDNELALQFLSRLQDAHDSVELVPFVPAVINKLNEVAEQFGLTPVTQDQSHA